MSDAVVIGAGAAGLAVALRLCEHMHVTLVCKAPLGSGTATGWAQGGIAAAVGPSDSPELHAIDTKRVGGGLNDASAVEILVNDAAKRITELIALGMRFDRESDGSLALGQEAAHSRRRILHAGGDATGREILRALTQAVRASSITILVATVDEIIVEHKRVVGIRAHRRIAANRIERFRLDASAVVLATGGCGQLFSFTTNPPEATGDGIALAARAGADVIDLEFMQFHPTALAVGLDPMPLITEALRGEGAYLVDMHGDSIMQGLDSRGDLAPRDVVARAVFEATVHDRKPALNARAIVDFASRFPTVYAAVQAAGLDPSRDLLPVASAAHYHMGGASVDTNGRTTLGGLWACGETASTGVHGANRLASNSLLEAIVFAARVADDIRTHAACKTIQTLRGEIQEHIVAEHAQNERALRTALRAIMYRGVGVIRDAESLQETLRSLSQIEQGVDGLDVSTTLSNMILVSRLMTHAALARCESRGSHQRRDYISPDSHFAQRTRLEFLEQISQ